MGAVIQTINNSAVRDGKYLPTLDGWRAIAILLVLIAHGSDSIYRAYGVNLHNLHGIGLFGVQIFFGLSGLLITSRLMADERKSGRISLKSFYVRRAFRILPASLVFLVVVAALAIAGVIPVTSGRWLSTLLFFANYSPAQGSWYVGHFWSLAVEEHFYFVWPLAFLLLATVKKRLLATIAAALIIALWRAIDFKFQITGATPAAFWGRTDIQVDNIIWGVVIALLYGDPIWRPKLENYLRQSVSIPTLTIMLLIFATIQFSDWKVQFVILTVKAIVIPLLILGTMINANQILSSLLETQLFKLLGRLSYSIYLWQQLFLVWNDDTAEQIVVMQSFPVNFVLVFVCAIMSMLFVEKPMITLGHAITNRVNSIRATSLH